MGGSKSERMIKAILLNISYAWLAEHIIREEGTKGEVSVSVSGFLYDAHTGVIGLTLELSGPVEIGRKVPIPEVPS